MKKNSINIRWQTIAQFITFYLNKGKIEKKANNEQKDEEISEIERWLEFPEKFSGINKIPILRNVVRRCYKEGWWYSIALLVCCFIFLGFGLHHLGKFMSVDEPKWVNVRVPQLRHALASRNWAETYINDKPGVLPSILSMPVNLFLDHQTYKADPLRYEIYLFFWRLPILLFNFLLLFAVYYFSKKLFRKDRALLLTGLIAVNPILIGISQIVNPDATLWSVSFLSFLTFFLYLKTNSFRYILFSGLFLGLALISKFFASIFYITFFLTIYTEYLLKQISREQFFSRCIHLVGLFGISILTYTLLFPATWVNYRLIIEGTIGAGILKYGINYFSIFLFFVFIELLILKGKLTSYLRDNIELDRVGIATISSSFLIFLLILMVNVFGNNFLFDFNNYMLKEAVRGQINFKKDFAVSFYTTLFTSSYAVLLGVLILSLATLNDYLWRKIKPYSLIIFSAYITISVFLFGSVIGGYVADARYQIMLYPLFAVAGVLTLFAFLNKQKLWQLSYFAISVLILINASPFYFHYTNALNLNNYVITDAWGFGGYELAQIMNKMPDARNLKVWVDREGFSVFFTGTSLPVRDMRTIRKKNVIDYIVLTRGGERIFQRFFRESAEHENIYRHKLITRILKIYTDSKEENQDIIYLNNNSNNFLRVLKLRKLNNKNAAQTYQSN